MCQSLFPDDIKYLSRTDWIIFWLIHHYRVQLNIDSVVRLPALPSSTDLKVLIQNQSDSRQIETVESRVSNHTLTINKSICVSPGKSSLCTWQISSSQGLKHLYVLVFLQELIFIDSHPSKLAWSFSKRLILQSWVRLSSDFFHICLKESNNLNLVFLPSSDHAPKLNSLLE